MSHLPRLALATPATGMEPSVASLAWMAGLIAQRWRVQHFRSRACPTATEAVGQVAGVAGRHLDAWLMPEPVLLGLFARGARDADLALVEGTLDEPPTDAASCPHDLPGRLAPIARTLDLPTVAVVPCPSRDAFHLPCVPGSVDAVFLDGIEHPEDYPEFRRTVELATRRPVVGAVEALPDVRAALKRSPRDCPITEELVGRLATSFLKFADLDAIQSLAASRAFPGPPFIRSPGYCSRRFRVAYAQDEAFGAYFPDTLEALRALGAELVEFSPLRDEKLPARVDLVMIGCGMPDAHAEALARNCSLILALNDHVCNGHRIYSEGGGTAYLGHAMVLPDGRSYPGAGILPFTAHLVPDPQAPLPVTRTLVRDTWLGARGTEVRGYISGRWRLVPGADPLSCPNCFGPLSVENDLYFHHHAVGGLMHLHLGALPEVVAAFAEPHHSSLTLPNSWRCT